MSIDRPTLIELYKATLEEFHNQERIYTQAFIGLGILIPVFLAAVSFLFGRDSYLRPEYVSSVKGGVFSLALVLAAFFWVIILRINGRFEACGMVAERIERKLLEAEMTEKTGGIAKTSELNGLLVRRALVKSKFDMWVAKYRLFIYFAISLLALVGLWFFLFECIDC